MIMLRPGNAGPQHRRRPRRDHPPSPGPGRTGTPARAAGPGAHRRGRRNEGDHRAPHPPAGVLQRGVHPAGPHAADPRAPSPRPPGPPRTTPTDSPGMGRTSLRPADLLDLTAWPKGMRVIMRRERPHQGAQLRFEDVGGYRLTAFATNTKVGQLADLEVRHRLRARCQDRIRCAKDTGLDRFPLQGFAQNRIWCLIVALARRPAGLLPAARPGRRPEPVHWFV